MPSKHQGIYWIGTLAWHTYVPWPQPQLAWSRGQLELSESGFLHWQLVIALPKKGTMAVLKRIFGNAGHWELARSRTAADYCWKEDTRVAGTQFEFGRRPICSSNKLDWDDIWAAAQTGSLDRIPSSIKVHCYSSLRRISTDFALPIGMERTCHVFWGPTGTGKSRRAWGEAGLLAYPKDPRTKWWCGYSNHEHVVIDEFRGAIDVSHLLRWLDRYPVLVEIKGGAQVLMAKSIWITSNLDPRLWYPDLDQDTLNALLRRLNITHFN